MERDFCPVCFLHLRKDSGKLEDGPAHIVKGKRRCCKNAEEWLGGVTCV